MEFMNIRFAKVWSFSMHVMPFPPLFLGKKQEEKKIIKSQKTYHK